MQPFRQNQVFSQATNTNKTNIAVGARKTPLISRWTREMIKVSARRWKRVK